MRTRRAAATILAAGGCLAMPAAAGAAGASVTGDDGNPVGLGAPVTIRNLDPKVEPSFSGAEVGARRDYTFQVLDPAGQVAASQTTCLPASGTTFPVSPEYRGNGTYWVVLTTYPDTARSSDGCRSGAVEQRLAFTIAGSVRVGPVPSRTLLREANSLATRPLEIPVGINPGASVTELRYARGGVIGPDGAISGVSQSAPVLSTTGRATAYPRTPGRYVFVARAKADNAFTPWSAPVYTHLVAPFDFEAITFTDARGPSYRVRARLRERTATGRVQIHLARGARGRYRKLGTVWIRRGTIVKRFRQSRTGRYRMRFTYAGGSTTAAGRIVEGVRFTRRLGLG